MQLYQSQQAVRHDGVLVEQPVDKALMIGCPFEVTTSYFNGNSCPISIVLRSGLALTLKPDAGKRRKDFIIRQTYKIHSDVKVDIHNVLNAVDDSSSMELKALKKAFEEQDPTGGKSYGRTTGIYTIDYIIHKDDLTKRGGSIYAPQVDLVVSCLTPEHVPKHPYSPGGIRAALIQSEANVNRASSFGYNIRIVDNAKVYGPRFVNIAGKVYKVPVTVDNDMFAGVYLTSSSPLEGDHDNCLPNSKHYTFEEADKELSLFRTFEDATCLGDPENVQRLEIQERLLGIKKEEDLLKLQKLHRDAAAAERKHELEQERTESDEIIRRQLAELEVANAKIKSLSVQQEHVRTIKAAEVKDKFEHRSHVRKDTTEVVKFVPAAIMGAVACFAIVKGFF